jgi:CheY-like chemotaxis protein
MLYVAHTADLFPLRTVLVVDPDPDTRGLYEAMLEGIAHDVQMLDDGRLALARALAYPPNLLVTEAFVPFIDGHSLCQLLRADPVTAHVPIVIATSEDPPSSVARARAAGADAVIIKPLRVESFVTEIHQAVANRADAEDRSRNGDREDGGVNSNLRNFGRAARRTRTKTYERYVTSTPPRVPPRLRCSHCDRPLCYLHSHIGGVNADYSEQWDHFECPGGCGSFEYRHRTRKLCRRSVSGENN